MPESKQPHPVADLLLTIVLPSVALEWLSAPAKLGPTWALVVASLLPLGFGVYCYATKQGLNFFSVLGLIAVLLNGGLGLLQLNAWWFAAKEISVPIFLGIAFPLSHRWGKPLVEAMLLSPNIINRPALERAVDTEGKKRALKELLRKASWAMFGAMMFSSAANFALVVYLLSGTEPGSEAYVKAIGKQNWLGFLVIGLPLTGGMLLVLLRILKRLQAITGLERDDLMNPGTTVRKKVQNTPP